MNSPLIAPGTILITDMLNRGQFSDHAVLLVLRHDKTGTVAVDIARIASNQTEEGAWREYEDLAARGCDLLDHLAPQEQIVLSGGACETDRRYFFIHDGATGYSGSEKIGDSGFSFSMIQEKVPESGPGVRDDFSGLFLDEPSVETENQPQTIEDIYDSVVEELRKGGRFADNAEDFSGEREFGALFDRTKSMAERKLSPENIVPGNISEGMRRCRPRLAILVNGCTVWKPGVVGRAIDGAILQTSPATAGELLVESYENRRAIAGKAADDERFKPSPLAPEPGM
jgi:hypothetical protein